jgi:SpoVK/Ycf46/Vps4 family AAA+-type ATPase
VKEIREHVEKQSAEKHHEHIDKWLSPADPSTNYSRTLKERHPGSGEWLLQDTRYSRWKGQPSSFLWLYGIPGCGKTVLSSTVIENLKADAGGDRVLYFYFSFTDV